jgi:hypothetical protein
LKLPEIKTQKKIRDAKICSMLMRGSPKQEIADTLGLSLRTIDRVVYKNATVLKNSFELTKDLEKVNRILFIKNQIRISKKFNIDLEYSPMTLMEDLREELEGRDSEATHVEYHKTIINYPEGWKPKEERIGDNASSVSSRLSTL